MFESFIEFRSLFSKSNLLSFLLSIHDTLYHQCISKALLKANPQILSAMRKQELHEPNFKTKVIRGTNKEGWRVTSKVTFCERPTYAEIQNQVL